MVKPAFAIIRSPEMANADRAKQVEAFHQCVIKNSKGNRTCLKLDFFRIGKSCGTFQPKYLRPKMCPGFFISSLVEFPKIEKVLKNFNCGSSVVEGKTSVGDLAVLAMHIASVYFKNEDDFKNLIPSGTAQKLELNFDFIF